MLGVLSGGSCCLRTLGVTTMDCCSAFCVSIDDADDGNKIKVTDFKPLPAPFHQTRRPFEGFKVNVV